jgi:hypothetical protein
MLFPSPPRDWTQDLLAAGDRFLAELGPAATAADPEGRVEPRSRVLCAALGLLSVVAYRALGGGQRAAEVGRAGAMLSLLTKIDDQVIDDLSFHGGPSADREELRRRTRAFLAPTLRSLQDACPANEEPRCAFAADLGCALRDLAGERSRLDHLLETIAMGWEVQVEAVCVLTSHPASVRREQVADITRRISGAWLLMIAMVGSLPEDAARPLEAAEEEGFFAWGSAIQRTDALADLAKDLADGHLSSYPGRLLWERAPEAYLDAAARGDFASIYALVRAHGVDRDCLPDPAEVAALSAALPGLGDVRSLLGWIQGYLSNRYSAHPLSAGRGARSGCLAAPSDAARLWPEAHGSAPCSAP